MDNNIEMRFCEVRAEGRALSGTAVRYGDVASFAWGRERIEPGAFAPLGDAILNAQHDRTTPLARTDGGGLTLLDSEAALEIRAELPPTRSADDVLELVRARVMRGLSIEFVALTERSEADVRIIERARLVGIAVVDTVRHIPPRLSKPAAPPLRSLAPVGVGGYGCEVALGRGPRRNAKRDRGCYLGPGRSCGR